MVQKRNRQLWLWSALTGVAAVGLASATYLMVGKPQSAGAIDPSTVEMVVYRSPTCGCCAGWEQHMSAAGFQTDDQVVDDIVAIKQEHNVPEELLSCHTTVVDGYVIEGHVPTDAVERLLAERPDVVGIAVPGMPLGTPGMEAGNTREPFTVFTFDEEGNTDVFAEYQF